MRKFIWIAIAGLLGGLLENAFLGLAFTSSPIKSILYNPNIQSKLFLEITPQRSVPLSVAVIVILSVIHSWLFYILASAIPGKTWIRKGLFWGFGNLAYVLGIPGMVCI